jgi:hypothetical protein
MGAHVIGEQRLVGACDIQKMSSMFKHGGVLSKMKIKRMVKRLFAVGTGVAMLGATAMGAMAADLNEYPSMFVTDGVYDGYLVVGENAASVDNLALTDIASSMKVRGGSSGSSTSISGDAWLVKAGSDVMEFTESIGPASTGVVDFLDDTELAALANGVLTSSQGQFDYEQFLHFDNTVINTTYEEDDNSVTALFLKIPDNQLFARYELNFLEAAESDVDTSAADELDDYEDKQLTMFGNTYDIVKATGSEGSGGKVTLILMSGAVTSSLLEGETQTYTIDGKPYEVSLTFTDSSSRAKFVINGEATPLMDESDTETLSDGTVFGLSETLYQDYAGGVHRADFFLGANKIELEDDSINTSGSTDELKVNDETIDGADVEIVGTILTAATASVDGEFEIDTIYVNMTSQDDYYIAAGETLMGQSELLEKDLLFTQNWDIRFEGLDSSIGTDEISVTDKSGEKEYELTFTNVNGQVVKVPLAFASGAALRLGDNDDNLTLNRTRIKDEQFFILNDDTDEDSVTHVIQYKGADDWAKSDPKIKFHIVATGENVERPVTFNDGVQGASATLKLSGTTYNVVNSSVGGTVSSKDWHIDISSGGADTWTGNSTADGVDDQHNYLIARGGAKIFIEDSDGPNVSATQSLRFNISLIDADRIDDIVTVSAASPYLVKGFNITAASSEVDLAAEIGVTLVSPDDDDDNSYGYGVNGAWIKRNSPSGGGTSADNLVIQWPHELKAITTYITSGATTTSRGGATGDLVAVEVVDATKLDSEVSNVAAQNLIVVGGPCVNTVAAQLLGNPSDCTEGFTPGKARVKLVENAGKVAMLVAGFSGADTRLAGRVVSHRWAELSGMEVEIEGTTFSDATISAPSAAPVAAPAAADTTDTTTG